MQLRELRLVGPGKESAQLRFEPGGNVVSGDSDTGKSVKVSNYFVVASTAPGMTVSLKGGGGTKTTSSELRGPDAANVWTISRDTSSGKENSTLTGTALQSQVNFSTFSDLQGGSGTDEFDFMTPGFGVSGSISGGGGINSLNYTA